MENNNLKQGIEILKKYEHAPDVHDMGNGEYYVGNMNIWEETITDDEIMQLKELGFTWYEEAECLLFRNTE